MTAMTHSSYNVLSSRTRTVLYYAISLGCVIALIGFASSSLRPLPVEEVITVDSTQSPPQPAAPVIHEDALPVADPDIETAGDRVAAAVIYLKRRQSELALNALQQAQVAAGRAVTKKPDGSQARQLISTTQEIERVKELIRKGRMGYAAKELKHVDQALDSVSY